MKINFQKLTIEIIFYALNLFTFVAAFVFLKNFEEWQKFDFEDYICILVCISVFIGCVGSLIRSQKTLVFSIIASILISCVMLGVLGTLFFRYLSYENEEETGIASTKFAIDLTALLLFGLTMQITFGYFILTELKREMHPERRELISNKSSENRQDKPRY